jgi:Putative peptidoglycan binding domain
MKRRMQILTAALLSAGVGLSAQSLTAQSTAPGGGAVAPNSPTQPGPTLPRETPPTLPGQPTPGVPQSLERMPGQPGTIPERVQPPSAGDQNMTVTSNDIKKAQDALKAKGLSPGTDGKLDAKTQAALRDFQKSNDLPATGVLDEKTAQKLGIKSSSDVRPIPERGMSSKPDSSIK